MLLIGLAGGKPEARREIADRLVQFGRQRMIVCPQPESLVASVRLSYLSRGLREAESNRAIGGVIVTHVMTAEEAEDIKRRGGEMWHVMGEPSRSVPMRLEDRKVTAMQGGCRHFLDAIEALSETLLDAAQRA